MVNFACSYFLALPVQPGHIPLPELLTVTRAAPLLKLLLHNEKDEDMKLLLQNCIDVRSDDIGLPLVASPITAMIMGFFAYKPSSELSEQSEQSAPLQLLKFCAQSLVDLHPPFSHPLCPFWIYKPAGLIRRIQNNEMRLDIQEFTMNVSQTAEYQAQALLVEQSQKARLQNRKRTLAQCIAQVEEELVEHKAEMQRIDHELAGPEQANPEASKARSTGSSGVDV